MKKIISLTIAIIVAFSFWAFPFVVSADNESEMTNQEYYASQLYLISKYKDGKISYSEFQEQSQAITDEFVSKNTVGGVLQSGALNASNTFSALAQKIGGMADKYGNAAYDYLSALASGLLDGYAVQNQNPTVDMNGSGALAVLTGVSSTRKIILHYYGDYGVIRNLSNVPYDRRHRLYSNDNAVCYHIEYAYDLNGKLLWGPIYSYDKYGFKEYDGVDQGGYSGFEYIESVKYYGDWRNEQDGTPIETDDTYETISDYDFTQATDKELEDLINDLLNEFELQMPDLSSIEGLLNAIYARLGTLDSDNDNELLTSVNSAILALIKTNNDNNKALLDELLKFREDLKNGTVGADSSAHGHEVSGTLYNVIPLDKNWLNKIFHDKQNLKVQYEGKTYYLEDCGCLKLDNKFYNVDINYSSQTDVDYDFGFDVSELNFLIKDEQKFYDIDFDTLNDLYSKFQSNDNSQTYSMRKTRKAISSVQGELQEKFSNYLTDQQVNNASIVSSMIEKFVAAGVPFEDIKKNFSAFEDILFNDYTPRDIVITYPYGHSYASFTILSYKWFDSGDSGVSTEHEGSSGDIHGGGGGSFGNGDNENSSDKIDSKTENFSKYSKIVRAFTSVLISFSWLFSMYKKMSSLI